MGAPSDNSGQVWLKSNVICGCLSQLKCCQKKKEERRKKETGAIQDLSVTKSRSGKETGAIQDLSVTKSRPGKKKERNRCDTRPVRDKVTAR